MRVELQQVQKNLQQQQIQGEQVKPLTLKKGEVVRATVLAQDGDTFLLKTQDGQLFKAKLQLDTVLNPQDQVEFMVTAKQGDKLSMQMISILSAGDTQKPAAADAALLQSLGLSDNPAAHAVLAAMKEMGMQASKTTLINALQIMQDAALTVKESVFFAANQIDVSQEAVNALRDMQQGQTTGVVLFEIAQEFAAGNELSPAQQTAQAAAGIVLADTAPEAPATPDAQFAQEAAPMPAAPDIGKQQLTQYASSALLQQAETAQTTHAISQETIPQETMPQETMSQETIHQESAPMGQVGMREHAAAALLAQPDSVQGQQEEALRGLTGKLLSMFVDIDSAMDGAKVKRAAADTAFRSELLHDIIQSGDVRSRALAERMTDVAAQTKLTQDVQRFYCLHIPVRHQSHDTAELYIYKNRKGGRGIDPENTSILIGLATETMGRVESLIKVEKRNISLVFSVEEERAIPLIKESARELYPLLRQHRYSLIDTKVNKLEQPTTLTNAEEVLTAAVSKPSVYVDCKV